MLEHKRAAVLVKKEMRSRAILICFLVFYTIYRFAFVVGVLENSTKGYGRKNKEKIRIGLINKRKDYKKRGLLMKSKG